jgi:hypothetical protein
MRFVLLMLLSCGAMSMEAGTYVASTSQFPGFILFTDASDSRVAMNIAISAIVEILSDGRGTMVICEVAGQKREFLTRMTAAQFAQLLAKGH